MLGNLREVATDSDVITYRVDGLGRRIAKLKNGVEVKRWTYATALNPVSELDVQTGRMKTFVYASRGNVPDLMTVREGATVTTYRFATDHLGSVRMVVNASCPQTVLPQDVYASCVVWHADYDEYGRRTLIGQSNPELHSFGFAGGLFDYETGLTRFGARDYDPYTGRWAARDPILFNGGTTNLYEYAHNDPVNFIDVTGRAPKGTVAYLVELGKRGWKVIERNLTFDEAVDAAKEGFDIMAKDKKTAREIAEAAAEGSGMCPKHDPAHKRTAGPNARPHYHPFGEGSNHIFYNLIPLLDFDGDGGLGWGDLEGMDLFLPGPTIFLTPETGPEA